MSVSTTKLSDSLPTRKSNVWFYLYTLWLFTRSDLKTVVYPATAFGVTGALSGRLTDTSVSIQVHHIVRRIPLVVLWIWVNLLVEVISNQRLPRSVKEDLINKPWRPLPAQRLTPQGARQTLILVIPCAFALSWKLGTARESAALMILTWMYNDLGGADDSILLRNLLNACGILSFNAGAMIVAAGARDGSLTNAAYVWLGMLGAIIFSTVHIQDLADSEGDATTDRKTIPLVYGEQLARWSVAVSVVMWSVLCPAYWTSNSLGYLVSVFTGGALAMRVVCYRGTQADRTSWKVWCIWITVLYFLPLCKNWGMPASYTDARREGSGAL